MIEKEKKLLLLKDLCGRLPYGVKIKYHYKRENNVIDEVRELSFSDVETLKYNNEYPQDYWCEISWKPYLRPMSCMTEEEILHMQTLVRNKNHELYSRIEECGVKGTPDWKLYEISYIRTDEEIDYLNSRYLDYHGLIPMGLALLATEGMYEF